MVALVKNEMTDMRNSISHALQYPETSKAIIDLLLVSAYRHMGSGAVRKLVQEFHLIP